MSEQMNQTKHDGQAPACCDSVLLSSCCGEDAKPVCCGPERAPEVCACSEVPTGEPPVPIESR